MSAEEPGEGDCGSGLWTFSPARNTQRSPNMTSHAEKRAMPIGYPDSRMMA